MSFSNANTGGKASDPYKEQNMDEPSIQDKVEDLSAFASACKYSMMTTRGGSSGDLMSRCMALAATEVGGVDLIFHTNTESGKTDDIAADQHVNIAFLNNSGEWASVSGTASVITDRSVVKKYYSPAVKAWLGDLGDGTHNGGPEDPRVGIIRVQAKSATYSISRKNAFSKAVEVAQGTVTGIVPSINKIRELSEKDIMTWRASNEMVQ